MAINSTATRAVLQEGIPSILHVLKKGKYEEKKRLDDYQIVKCAPGEIILEVQRQHKIAFILPLITQMVMVILVLVVLFFSFLNTKDFNLIFSISLTYLCILLATISFFLELTLYNFLSWYYNFYVITNKAIIHRHSFRIGGEYSETVYGEKMHVQDVDRVAQNLLYDILKIQDVYVYFHKLEREEPFIFKTPESSQKIDDTIQKLITESRSISV